MSTSPGAPNIKNPPTAALAGGAVAALPTLPLSEGLSHLSEKALAQIKARAEAATAGEWKSEGSWIGTSDDDQTIAFMSDHRNRRPRLPAETKANAELIAHARQDIPLLLAHIEYLQGRLDAAVQP